MNYALPQSPVIVAHIFISVLPVLCFLAALVSMDSYKLLSIRSVLTAIGAGVVAALFCYLRMSGFILGFEIEHDPL